MKDEALKVHDEESDGEEEPNPEHDVGGNQDDEGVVDAILGHQQGAEGCSDGGNRDRRDCTNAISILSRVVYRKMRCRTNRQQPSGCQSLGGMVVLGEH